MITNNDPGLKDAKQRRFLARYPIFFKALVMLLVIDLLCYQVYHLNILGTLFLGLLGFLGGRSIMKSVKKYRRWDDEVRWREANAAETAASVEPKMQPLSDGASPRPIRVMSARQYEAMNNPRVARPRNVAPSATPAPAPSHTHNHAPSQSQNPYAPDNPYAPGNPFAETKEFPPVEFNY